MERDREYSSSKPCAVGWSICTRAPHGHVGVPGRSLERRGELPDFGGGWRHAKEEISIQPHRAGTANSRTSSGCAGDGWTTCSSNFPRPANGPEAQLLRPAADHKGLITCAAHIHAKNYEGHSRITNFSRAEHAGALRAGYHDAVRTLRASSEVLQRSIITRVFHVRS